MPPFHWATVPDNRRTRTYGWKVDCFTSHVGEHRTVRGLCKFREFPEFVKYPQCSSPRKRKRLLTPFVYVTLATHVTLATAGYTPCLFGYVTIGLARHNRTHFSQSERLLVKPQRPCTDLCAEPAGVWNRLGERRLQRQQSPPAAMKTSSFPVHLCLTRVAITPVIWGILSWIFSTLFITAVPTTYQNTRTIFCTYVIIS